MDPIEKTPETLTFHQKLVQVQKACYDLHLTPEATGQVQNREYKYLTIQKLHAAVLPILHGAGLSWTTFPTTGPALSYSLSDGDETFGDVVPLIGCSDMQKLGSAITYARRYALLAVLGLTPDVDDDGNIASKGSTETPKPEGPSVPAIPLDRARAILTAAVAAGLAEGTELRPTLKAKLTEVGVESGKIGHLNVDQAEAVESFIAKEVAA
jgi:hypothetical protein